MIPAVLGNELCDVRQELRDDIRILGSGDERGGSSGGCRKRCDRINQRLLQPEQVCCRLDYDPAKANGFVRYEVIPERRKLLAGWMLVAKHFVDGCVHLVEVRCLDVLLQH